MKKNPATRAIAIAGLGLAIEAGAMNTFDDATGHLTLHTVTVDGVIHSNVAARIDAYSVLDERAGMPGPTSFDPGSGVLRLGSVHYDGNTYTNVTVRVDDYALQHATERAPAPCRALAPPKNVVIEVSTAADLVAAVSEANSAGGNRTIALADGVYELSAPLLVSAPDITVRGASGDRDAVIIHGAGMTGGVMHVFLVRGSRFTVADLSLGGVANHGIQIQGEHEAHEPTVHNVRFADTGEQMLKVSYNRNDMSKGSNRGVVQCSLFEYTAGVGPQYYIGGIDAHNAADWIVRNNTFRAIRSPESRLAEHAIHFWSASRNTLVERNIIVDSDRGIGFGLGNRSHLGGTIRNNMVYTTRDVGIGLESSSGTRVVNNSVYTVNYPNAIEYRFSATENAFIANNLTRGAIARRDDATATLASNHTSATEADFEDPTNGNLRLATPIASVIDQALALPDVRDDIDGTPRPQGSAPDIGAHEWSGR